MKQIKFALGLFFGFFVFLFQINNCFALPNGFVYLKDVDPSIIQDIRYYTNNNFVGHPIAGYDAPQCILTKKAALKLAKIQQKLKLQSLSLKVFDCYRPQMAVNQFISWSKDPLDQKMKSDYYPNVNKEDFFKLDYVAAKSGHTRGSTVDLTIVHLSDEESPIELKMGTHFDYLDPASHPLQPNLSETARRNQLFLRNVMFQAGFKPILTEWWHFTLKDEPYPDTYFNFPVT